MWIDPAAFFVAPPVNTADNAIQIHVLLGSRALHVELPGETEGRHPVYETKVDRLGGPALIRRHHHRVTSRVGDLDATVAVAENPDGGVYPAGSVVLSTITQASPFHLTGELYEVVRLPRRRRIPIPVLSG